MSKQEVNIFSLVNSIYKNKNLLIQMTKRVLLSKYKGSFLGFFWTIINPIFMLLVYTFAFSVVFKSKWGLEQEGHFDFAIILFASLIIFNIFAETIRDSPSIIIINSSYVKKVVFPLEILPIINLCAAMINATISLMIMIVMFLLVRKGISFTILYLPLVLIPLLLITLGFSYILSAIGVFLRDINQIVTHALTVLLFTSPIFFSIDRVPIMFKKFIYLNPIALIIEEARKIIIFGIEPNFIILASTTLVGFLSLCIGFFIFQKLRNGFADVL
jgi:lipopolysaccharide transport system permease protein